jgi:carbonic anhydrase
MNVLDELFAEAGWHADLAAAGPDGREPRLRLVVVTCMDTRVNPYEILRLKTGDAHVLRNAGGVITPDMRRSLVVSQRELGTRHIIVMHHTRCGMAGITDTAFKDDIEADTRLRPDWALEAFTDVDQDVDRSIRRIQADRTIPHRDSICGCVYDVDTHEVRRPRWPADGDGRRPGREGEQRPVVL